MMEEMDKVVDFLADCEKYLHSWACTRTGEYKPINTRATKHILGLLVANGSQNPIEDYKKGVEDGTIMLGTYCIGITDERRKQLYEKHRENIEEFEKKYNIKNEEDKQ